MLVYLIVIRYVSRFGENPTDFSFCSLMDVLISNVCCENKQDKKKSYYVL